MLTTSIVVRRIKGTLYGTIAQGTFKGSGYCEDHYDRQYLIKEWRLFGFRVWKRTLDSEDVPVYASVSLACVGYTEWRSKFQEYIT